MLFMFRVLNELDILCNPLENGLASKKLIYDLTMSYLKSNEKDFLNSLTKKEKEQYCKNNMENYIKTHQHKLKKMIERRGIQVYNNLSGFDQLDAESWSYLYYYLSSLNTHLVSGSKTITDWISTTKDLNLIKKYYNNQTTHKVAVLASSGKSIKENGTLIVDLSSKNNIKELSLLIPKKINSLVANEIIEKNKGLSVLDIESTILNDVKNISTNDKFRGFNYANSDKEICIYRYYSSKHIVAVLEALQLDLVFLQLFNFDYFKLNKNEQIKELNKLKEILLQEILKLNDPYLLHIFEKLYVENINIKYIQNDIYEKEKINHNRIKILKIAKNIPNIQINNTY